MDTTLENPAQILVIDDNHGEVQELREALTECGEQYELSVLQDGEAALRFVADHRSGLLQPEPCVIVLDLNLPKHDALAVLAAIKLSLRFRTSKFWLSALWPCPRPRRCFEQWGAFVERGR